GADAIGGARSPSPRRIQRRGVGRRSRADVRRACAVPRARGTVQLRRRTRGALARQHRLRRPAQLLTHVVDVSWRDGDRTEQFWTQDSVPGLRFGGTKPVWILTSKATFSAGEQFAYDLKNLKRATLVGEPTG